MLNNEAQTVKLRPFMYLIIPKDENERMVMEMKEAGIVKDNISFFASPVFLLRKRMDLGGFVWTIDNSIRSL